MAPQVGFEPHPEIPTAETIVLKIVKNTRKTSVDAGFEGVFDLSLKAGKTCQVEGRQYKSSTFFGHENRLRVFAANPRLSETLVGCPAEGRIRSRWFRFRRTSFGQPSPSPIALVERRQSSFERRLTSFSFWAC